MEIYLVNFATSEFRYSQCLLNLSAVRYGIHKINSFDWDDILGTEFYAQNKYILDQKRGAGYWLWKPYFIIQILQKIPENSALLYLDSGTEIIKDLLPLFEICKESPKGIVLFSNSGHLNKTWTKRDCFLLTGCDSKEYWDGRQVSANFQLYKKNDQSIDFVREWLDLCKDPNILTDLENVYGKADFTDFVDHRHDQSVLSLLSIKYDIEIYRDPSQFGNPYKMEKYRHHHEFLEREYVDLPFLNSEYDTLFFSHRHKYNFLQYLKLRLKNYTFNN